MALERVPADIRAEGRAVANFAVEFHKLIFIFIRWRCTNGAFVHDVLDSLTSNLNVIRAIPR